MKKSTQDWISTEGIVFALLITSGALLINTFKYNRMNELTEIEYERRKADIE